MQTQCPTCKSSFRVKKDQLKQADGLVRCGNCSEIFNGYDQLLKSRDKMAGHTPDMLKSMLLGRRPNLSKMATLRWSAIITLAALCLLLQLSYIQRSQLAQHTYIGPYIKRACERIPKCEITPRQDLTQIQLVSRNIYSHPNVEKALMINAVITNTATAGQPFPTLLVSMSNVRGQVVAKRYFKPHEYLAADAAVALMEPGKAVSINLEVMDPGQNALAFELDFI